jgi:hypothetical protein
MNKRTGGAPWVVAYNPKTFRLKSLKMTIVGIRGIAPYRGGVCKVLDGSIICRE